MQRRRTQRDTPDDDGRATPVPGTITDLTSQARDPERINVFIDGTFALGVARTVSERLGLAIGQELPQQALDTLRAEEDLHRAVNAALHFLAYRPRSEGEIRQRLRRSGTSEEVIDQVIAQLRDWRYVDDEDFAQRWIDNRLQHRPRGSRLLAQELRAKGVDPGIVNESIANANIDEDAQALDVARKRLHQLANLDPAVRERRLVAFLQRRGFGYDSIRRALDQLGSDMEGDDPFENE